jgi:hypothetical protein
LLAAPLAPNSWAPGAIGPETRVRIFPGLATWRVERDTYDPGRDVYRAFTPDRLPLRVGDGGEGNDCLLVIDDEASAFLQDFRFEAMPDHVIPAIACADTVYESVGGGVVLIKDFAGGVGLERVIRDRKIGLWH